MLHVPTVRAVPSLHDLPQHHPWCQTPAPLRTHAGDCWVNWKKLKQQNLLSSWCFCLDERSNLQTNCPLPFAAQFFGLFPVPPAGFAPDAGLSPGTVTGKGWANGSRENKTAWIRFQMALQSRQEKLLKHCRVLGVKVPFICVQINQSFPKVRQQRHVGFPLLSSLLLGLILYGPQKGSNI